MLADSSRLSENVVFLTVKHPFWKPAGISDRLARRLPGISGRLPGFGCRGVEGPGVAFGGVKR